MTLFYFLFFIFIGKTKSIYEKETSIYEKETPKQRPKVYRKYTLAAKRLNQVERALAGDTCH